MDNPIISVIIPFYKGQDFIVKTLQSLFDQEYSTMEIIVVNDGSPEETLSVLAPFAGRITVLSQENAGVACARNTGIKHASGSIIGLIDQDDLWPEGRIATMLPFLMNGEYDFVRGMTQKFRIDTEGNKVIDEPMFCQELIGAALYKKSVFDEIGFFDESMREGDDFDWNIRLNESVCREKKIPDTTLFCHRHDRNQSDEKDYIKKGHMMSLKKKLERARAHINQQ